jgi:hypothetical protein
VRPPQRSHPQRHRINTVAPTHPGASMKNMNIAAIDSPPITTTAIALCEIAFSVVSGS